jgi:ABC-type transport system involved in multi-copper enzyme maturation permease subunit
MRSSKRPVKRNRRAEYARTERVRKYKDHNVKRDRDDVRSKRFILIGIFYIGFAIVMAGVTWYIYEKTPTDLQGIKPADFVFILMNLFNFILFVLAIMISSDSISLEKRERTIYQLLSKPVERSSVIIGKFLGSMITIFSFFVLSSAIAYLLASVSTGVYPDAGQVMGVMLAVIAMVLVFAVYVSIGLLISVFVKNPVISIISAIIIWIAFSAISFIGSVIGILMSGLAAGPIVKDPFDQFPIYAKLMIWISPSSHSIMSQFIGSDRPATVSGFPMWANVVFLLAYAAILLSIAIVVFKRQDL